MRTDDRHAITCARSAQPCIEGFFGGRFARALEARRRRRIGGAEHRRDRQASSATTIASKLKPLAESRWAHDPFARGSYSHALPGHAGARAVLAAPVDGRLFFAGEATSPGFFSTAHGARDSGERAAAEVLALLEAITQSSLRGAKRRSNPCRDKEKWIASLRSQ